MQTRRALLRTAVAVLPVAVLAACAGTSAQNTVAVVVTDLKNAVPALSNSLHAVEQTSPGTIPAPVAAQMDAALTAAANVVGSLSTSMTATEAAPLVQQVEADLNAVITAAAAVPMIPPPYSTALAAAAVVLPIVEAFVNSVLPQPVVPVAKAARARAVAAHPMSVDEARAALARLAH